MGDDAARLGARRRRVMSLLLGMAIVAGSLGLPASAPLPVRAGSATLAREIDGLLGDTQGLFGIVVATPDGAIAYARNARLPFIAASLYKLPVMVAVYQAADRRTLSLDEGIWVEGAGWVTIGDAVAAMIVVSSNEAAYALIGRIGLAAVNQAATDLGLEHTRVGIDPATAAAWIAPAATTRDGIAAAQAVQFLWAAAPAAAGWPDVTTPYDIATLFKHLYARDVVSNRASRAMLRLLSRQAVNDRFPVLLPPHTTLAHKTGNLPGVVHDAGIVATPDGPIILVAMTEDVADEAEATLVLQKLARIVYEHYGGRPTPRAAAVSRCTSPIAIRLVTAAGETGLSCRFHP